MGKYALELWSPGGVLLADLSGRASGRRIVQKRNEADDIRWRINLDELEDYARRINTDPRLLLINGQTEVRIRRGTEYVAGGQLVYYETRLNQGEEVIDLRATGFLNLFKDRFTGTTTAGSVQESFLAAQATTIAATLITQSQALANGNFGITIGTLATVGVHDRNYQRTNLKNALQDLTTVQTAPFDFEFTADKVFNTYAQIGSVRPDIIFEYPNNLKSISVPNDATGLANQIIALGSGFGTDAQAQYEANDTPSQLNRVLRQKVITSNATDNSDNGLTDAANAEVAAWRNPLEVPFIVADGNVAPFVTDYGIGDYVTVRVNNHLFLDHLDALFRVEARDLSIDDNDNEEVTLGVAR